MWADQYIGLPYRLGARGPDAFDCWGLLLKVFKEQKATHLPDFGGSYSSELAGRLALTRGLEGATGARQAVEVVAPEEPFTIALRAGDRGAYHCGVFTGHGILHSEAGCSEHIPLKRFIETRKVKWFTWQT